MKKITLFLLAAVLAASLLGCSGERYSVDYHGQESFFTGAKESYAAGTRVKLKYDLIATDTDYSFYVVGADYSVDWSTSDGAYVIQFTMPERDIEVYCESVGSMENFYDAIRPVMIITLVPGDEPEIPDGEAGMTVTDYYIEELTAVIQNRTDEELTVGKDFTLLSVTDSGYTDIAPEQEQYFENTEYTLAPGEEETVYYDLSAYGELPAGKYRIVDGSGISADFELREEWTE